MPPRPGKPERFDCEYERKGTANLSMLVAPPLGLAAGQCHHRTRVDFAQQMRLLVDECFPQTTVIRGGSDNLPPPNPASLHEAFAPAEAGRILDRLEFHHTPKPGSRPNLAEIALSRLRRQCLKPRRPNAAALRWEINALGGKPLAAPTKRASTGPSASKTPAKSSSPSTRHLQRDDA